MSHPKIPIFEYNYIVDGIFIGTNQCCQTHFDEILIKKGVAADISVEKEKIDMPYGVDFFCWIPVKDGRAPTMKQLTYGVAALEKCVQLKEKVYIHCQNGHGRAPTFVAAYLIKSKKLTPHEAYIFIKNRRKSIHLRRAQLTILKKFAKQF